MKEAHEVIREFNEVVNMTASELEAWLKSDDSQSAGWPKEGDDGESVGHESGRRIVDILSANPDKEPDKYTEDQVQHMRKVVAYCKRHLAQEEGANSEKSDEEVTKTKSFASLKNWGHDVLKKRHGGQQQNGDEPEAKKEAAGEKRKEAPEDEGNAAGANKKRETEKGGEEAATNGEHAADGAEETDGKAEANGGSHDGKSHGDDGNDKDGKSDDEKNDKPHADEKAEGDANGAEADDEPAKGPEVGDTVSWKWGAGQPEGKVLDVKDEKTTITTKRGNEVSRDGNPEDPAVVLDTGKSKAVKADHELIY